MTTYLDDKQQFSYEEFGDKFLARFPVCLLSEFKSVFKSARWNRDKTAWEIGPRSLSRFKNFCETALKSGLLATIEENEALEMSDEEMRSLENKLIERRNKFQQYNDEIKKRSNVLARILEVKALLEEQEDNLRSAISKCAAQKEEIQSEAYKIQEKIRDVVDFDYLQSKKLELDKFFKKGVTSFLLAREKEEAASIISEFYDAKCKLENLGIRNKAIDFIASANINRCDRDSTTQILDGWWSVFTVIND